MCMPPFYASAHRRSRSGRRSTDDGHLRDPCHGCRIEDMAYIKSDICQATASVSAKEVLVRAHLPTSRPAPRDASAPLVLVLALLTAVAACGGPQARLPSDLPTASPSPSPTPTLVV